MSHQRELDSREFPETIYEPVYIHIVKSRLHLVQNAERCGLCLQYCEHQRDGCQGLLTARQQIDILKPLSWRLRYDIYIRSQRVVLVR